MDNYKLFHQLHAQNQSCKKNFSVKKSRNVRKVFVNLILLLRLLEYV